MIKILFTDNEIEKLRELAQHYPHHSVRNKALALLLKSYHIASHEIIKIVGICENTLRTYCKGYLKSGIEAVEAINFRKPQSSLKSFEDIIKNYLQQTPPASIKQACHEIEKLCGIKLKESQMRKHLKSFGAKIRKVCGIPAKVNVEAQKHFLENELQPRLDEAKEGKRSVLFVDSSHFVQGAFLGYLWCLTRIFVKTPSGRKRFNVLGALNGITKELITVTNDTYITSTQVCELLGLIANKCSLPITVVCDNARYQRCKLVMDEAKKLGIELLFLPPYSPNLNLIERLWKLVKKRCLSSKYYSDFCLFKGAINNFLAEMHDKYKAELSSLLTLNFQTFADTEGVNPVYSK